jgi:hypothetical protein
MPLGMFKKHRGETDGPWEFDRSEPWGNLSPQTSDISDIVGMTSSL